MARSSSLRFVLVVLLLAILACSPIPSLPNPNAIANTAIAAVGGTAGASIASTAAAAVAAGLGPTPAFTPQPTPDFPADSLLPDRIKQGSLTLDSATISGDGSQFYGPIMQLRVTNPGSDEVLTTIPCGLIFQPDSADYQRLMVVQAYSATVGAGKSANLKPYVVCIDSDKHAPATDATYKIGAMATADLLKLAACICTQPLTFNTDIGRELGLEVAVWHVSDPEFPGNLSDSPFGPALAPFIKAGLATANGWLKSCGLATIPSS